MFVVIIQVQSAERSSNETQDLCGEFRFHSLLKMVNRLEGRPASDSSSARVVTFVHLRRRSTFRPSGLIRIFGDKPCHRASPSTSFLIHGVFPRGTSPALAGKSVIFVRDLTWCGTVQNVSPALTAALGRCHCFLVC